jgi:hypothetical protein
MIVCDDSHVRHDNVTLVKFHIRTIVFLCPEMHGIEMSPSCEISHKDHHHEKQPLPLPYYFFPTLCLSRFIPSNSFRAGLSLYEKQ